MGRWRQDGEDDETLWQFVARTVTPLKNGRLTPSCKPPAVLPPLSRETDDGVARPAMASPVLAPPGMPGLDGRTADRLRRGRLPIDGRLDLHGMTQGQAQDALRAFVLDSHARGRRCLLVITGKGGRQKEPEVWYEPPPGILRDRVPDWLAMPPLASLILRVSPAQRRHGGDGALYVLLRRQRD